MSSIHLTYHSQDDGVSVQMQRLLGGKTGLVNHVSLQHRDRGDPDVYATRSNPSRLECVVPADVEGITLAAGGKGRSFEDSVHGAIGETVERYCGYSPDPAELVEATHEQLTERGSKVVDAACLDLYAQSQLDRIDEMLDGFQPFDPGLTLQWRAGTDLCTGERVYVPAQLVYLAEESGSSTTFVGTSNGMACGQTLREALTRSIFEYVERDAFMRYWFTDRRPTRLDAAHLETVREVQREFETPNVSYPLFEYDTDTDFSIVGCAMIDGRDRTPKFGIGGAAELDPVRSMLDALMEGAQMRFYAKRQAVRFRNRRIGIHRVSDLDANVAYYARAENFDAVEPFVSADPERRYEPADVGAPATLADCLEVLDAQEWTPIAFDLTTRDVAEVGLHVTKVVIPELVSISLPPLPPKNHPRLRDETVRDRPHPFP